MAVSTAKVQGGLLYLVGEERAVCSLDTPEWFAWLETGNSFRYYTPQRITVTRGYTRPMRPISVRKEKRRQGMLWYAYLRTHGQLYKRYVGKTAALTQSKLDEVSAYLNEIW